MPKKDKKEELNKIQQDLSQILKKYDGNEKLQDEDLEALTELIDHLSKSFTWKAKLLYFIQEYLLKYIVFFVICMLMIGFMFNSIMLSNKLEILYIGVIVSSILTGFEMLPKYFSNTNPKLYIALFGVIVLNMCMFNLNMKIFSHATLWIVYILGVETLYVGTMYLLSRRKLNGLKENENE